MQLYNEYLETKSNKYKKKLTTSREENTKQVSEYEKKVEILQMKLDK